MKNEVIKTVDILLLLTNKISTIKQKADTFLTLDDYNFLSGKLFLLLELLSGSLTDELIPLNGSNDRYQPRFEITVLDEIMMDDYVGLYYYTGEVSPKNTKLYRHVDNSNYVAYFEEDTISFLIYKGTSWQFSIPHCNPDDLSLKIGSEYTDGATYKLTIIG